MLFSSRLEGDSFDNRSLNVTRVFAALVCPIPIRQLLSYLFTFIVHLRVPSIYMKILELSSGCAS